MKIISTWITNRKQYAHIESVIYSCVKHVKVGVHLGSALGPFFFIVVIYDLTNTFRVR